LSVSDRETSSVFSIQSSPRVLFIVGLFGPGVVSAYVAVACASVIFRSVDGGATGPLRASGDTRWPLYAELAGMYLIAPPLAAVGALAPTVGVLALYTSLLAETAVPAAITYYRFRSGTWRVVSRSYRPDVSLDD